MKTQLTSRNKFKSYWKNGWTAATISYFSISIIFYLSLVLIVRFAYKGENQKDWQTAITVSFGICLAINTLIILVRKGLGRGLFRPLIDLNRSRIINSRAKSKYTNSMTQAERDKILNRERREYDMELNNKAKNRQFNETNNLCFYLLIAISIFAFLILIPFFILRIRW
ncbi:hypothetical protein HGG64_02750 [Mycoplasma phocoeninasale]|uniref:DUF3899 domain-containing protein n=1 Tax=Mycoplasma phocoeninasale TaxID=2726117 RepID=A0A858U5T5_9MOLU|nr:hypothetical protein [Mycoplasma phocoeninasale]QJG66603.1 hypothetical protein HGG64_02750 [Mycoplasma phocoeninasale]